MLNCHDNSLNTEAVRFEDLEFMSDREEAGIIRTSLVRKVARSALGGILVSSLVVRTT
jgi:hypothetical protein